MKCIDRKITRLFSIPALFLFTLLSAGVHAAAVKPEIPTAQQLPSEYRSPLFIGLVVLIIVLFIAILVFVGAAKAAIFAKREEQRKENGFPGYVKTLIITVGLSVLGHTSQAADTLTLPEVPERYWGVSPTTLYLLITIILLELVFLRLLYRIVMEVSGEAERKSLRVVQHSPARAKRPVMDRLNASVSLDRERDIMLDHDYDGIRELDNDLPPWWKYGFYLTIFISVVYLMHFHVFGTGKSQLEEYEDQIHTAQLELEEFQKKSANLVDETNVKVLTDASSLSSGQAIYLGNCATCHGRAGEGGVGPNLTDEYWMHKGSIADIFKTIKYGWPEKGMKSWKQDLSPKQMHEVSSYIKSLAGTSPANPKAKQGELFIEENLTAVSDSTSAEDTLHVIK